MANIPIINPPEQDCDGWCWHHQFTIPLLFDDCLSLLQKVCALWAKLNDVIGALNEFNDEFNTWAKEVERQLADLYNKYNSLDVRVTKCENDIKNINQTLENVQNRLSTIENNINNINQQLTNLSNRVSTVENAISEINKNIQNINQSINKITNDILDLEQRVEKLENLLKNLNIIPPQTILSVKDNDSAWATIWGNWWKWFCDNVVNFASGDSKANWTMSNNLKWHDTVTKPERKIQVGYLGQPVCLVKLPFIAVRKNVWTSKPTIADIVAKSPTFKTDALYPAVGFFDLPLSAEFGFTMDEVKLMTSYIPFLTKDSEMVKNGSTTFAVQTDIRLQIPKTGTNAKLAVVPQSITVAAVPNNEDVSQATAWDLYIYCIAENG